MSHLEQEVRNQWNDAVKNNSVKEFFVYYDFLTLDNLAYILSINIDKISDIKAKYIPPVKKKKTSTRLCYTVPVELDSRVDPFINTREWWAKHYAFLGLRKLSRLSGLHIQKVKFRLKQLKIPYQGQRPVSSANKSYNYKLLYDFHIVRKYSISRIAKICGVTRYTIRAWLIKLGIRQQYKRLRYVGTDSNGQVIKVF